MINFAVGPVMMEDEILKIGSNQIPYFRTEEFSNIILENEKLLKEIINAPCLSRVIFLTGSGTAAMESVIINVFNREDKILVVNGGSFGERFKKICDIYNFNFDEIKLDYFEPLTKKHLQKYNGKGYSGFLINVHETSTGVLYDMEIVREFCKANNILLVVDAISSFLSDPFDMSHNNSNITILSSQKAISLPPGMSYIVIDLKAQDNIKKNNVKSLYFNLIDYLNDGERGQTPYTPAVNNLIQLNKKLHMIINNGIDSEIKKVENLASDFRKKIKDFPFIIPSKNLSNTLTPLQPIGEASAYQIYIYLKNNYDIFVAPNGGDLKEKLFRVGHIGALKVEDNDAIIEAFDHMRKDGIL